MPLTSDNNTSISNIETKQLSESTETTPAPTLQQTLQQKLVLLKNKRTGRTYRERKQQVKNSKVKNKLQVQRNLANEAVKAILSKAGITGSKAEEMEKDIFNELLLNNISNPMDMAQVITKHLDLHRVSQIQHSQIEVPQIQVPQIAQTEQNQPVGITMRKPNENLVSNAQ